MEVWKESARRMVWSALWLCAALAAVSPAAAQQSGATGPAQATAPAPQVPPAELPDSPGATLAKLQAPIPQQGSSEQSSTASSVAQPQGQPPAQSTSTQSPQTPVGTAAAEPMHASGIAASQPAGVAIAPVKQRRVRTIVIRVGAIIGAAVAVGAVVALTEATPSKPPGAH